MTEKPKRRHQWRPQTPVNTQSKSTLASGSVLNFISGKQCPSVGGRAQDSNLFRAFYQPLFACNMGTEVQLLARPLIVVAGRAKLYGMKHFTRLSTVCGLSESCEISLKQLKQPNPQIHWEHVFSCLCSHSFSSHLSTCAANEPGGVNKPDPLTGSGNLGLTKKTQLTSVRHHNSQVT